MFKKIMEIALFVLIAVVAVMLIVSYHSDEKENLVSGYGHIYKGQRLDPDWQFKLEKLSERASWLNTTQYLDPRARDDLEELIKHAEKDGMCLTVLSGYRSPEQQELLYNSVNDKTKVARPYESEHQTALAVDFAACPMNEDGVRDDSIERLELKKEINELPEYEWLLDNAHKYSFEQSFTELNTSTTGFPEEPWHWKYMIEETDY